MYYEVRMRQMLLLKPSELGDGILLQKAFVGRLIQNVNRVPCTEEHGYIVTITTIEDVSEGKIRTDTGSVAFSVDFNAIVCYLHEKEVVEVEVESVSKLGCVTNAGPCNIFLPADFMPDTEFKAAADDAYNCFKGDDGSEIRKGSIVRLEVYRKQWNAEHRAFRYIGSLAREECGLCPGFEDVNDVPKQGESPAVNWDKLTSAAPAGLAKDGKSGWETNEAEDGNTGWETNEAADTAMEVEEGGHINTDVNMVTPDTDEVVVDLSDSGW